MKERPAGSFHTTYAFVPQFEVHVADVFAGKPGIICYDHIVFRGLQRADEARPVVGKCMMSGFAAQGIKHDFRLFLCQWGLHGIGYVKPGKRGDTVERCAVAFL